MPEKDSKYDLEERTYKFARGCRDFCRRIPATTANREYSGQLIRSSGSTASNYIEANESLSRKDYSHRVKICRKEVKESRLWLRLIDCGDKDYLESETERLKNEATELMRIFGSVLEKCN